MYRLATLALLIAVGLNAQPPGGLIGGIVRNAWSKTALRRAVVTLMTTGSEQLEAVTYSDPNGFFGFTGVPAGDYFLCVDYPRYQRLCFGASDPGQPVPTLALSPGQRKNDIVLGMLPLGSISGTVTDSDGDPLPNTQVQMLRPIYSRRTLHWQAMNSASTNDRGEYRLSFVQPGQYRLMATRQFQPSTHLPADVTNGQKTAEELDATQFYPHADTIGSAATLTLSTGNDLKAIDFSLTGVRQATVSGKVIPPPGLEPNVGINIQVIPVVPGLVAQQFGAGAGPPDFHFQVQPLPQGQYRLIANVSSKGRNYSSSEVIEAGAGTDDLTITLTAGSPLAGHVKLEGAGAAQHGPYRVRLSWGDDVPFFGEQPVADVQPDGSFHFEDVIPGIWDIDVEPHPPGSYLKAMTYGAQDVLTEEMKLPPGERPEMNLTVSMNGAIIQGSVVTAAGTGARAMVLLAPQGKFEDVLSFYGLGEADAGGNFHFQSVTPGRYKIYAFDHMQWEEYLNPSFLKPYAAMGEAFDVGEGARLDRKTTLIMRGPEGTQ